MSESSLLLRKSKRADKPVEMVVGAAFGLSAKSEARGPPSAQLDDTPCEGNMARQQGPSSDSSRPSLTPVPPATTTTTSQIKRAMPSRPCHHHSIASMFGLQPWLPPVVVTRLNLCFSHILCKGYQGLGKEQAKRNIELWKFTIQAKRRPHA